MFDEEMKKAQEEQSQRELAIWKQKMIDFAEYHNRKRGEN
jgi:hypothetical protein